MLFFNLHRRIPTQTKSKRDQKKELVQEFPRFLKVVTMLKMTEKVKSEAQKLALQGIHIAKQGTRVTNLIRIQIEETKRKVGVFSPAALRFIGPGDHERNLIQRGGIMP